MEKTVTHPRWKAYKSRDTGRWNVYKSVFHSRWVVWNTGWPWRTVDTLKFDTWQQAMDYVNGKVES